LVWYPEVPNSLGGELDGPERLIAKAKIPNAANVTTVAIRASAMRVSLSLLTIAQPLDL
jgi:hypothetical protein